MTDQQIEAIAQIILAKYKPNPKPCQLDKLIDQNRLGDEIRRSV